MKILALDTSRKISDATFLDTNEERIITESCAEKNNESLLLMIQCVLRKADVTLDSLDGMCVCVGPGSFTGLRIGITTMKTFAQMKNLPLYGMNTLKAMQKFAQSDAVPLLDARGGRVYAPGDSGQATVLQQAAELAVNTQYLSFPSDSLAAALGERTVTWLSEDTYLSQVLAKEAAGFMVAGAIGDWRLLLPDYVGVSQAEREREKKRCRD